MAPYLGAALLLLLCQIGQSAGMLLLPSLSADIIDLGVLKGDPSYILRMSVVMLGAAGAQILLAIGTAWLGAHIAFGFGRDLRSAVFARVQSFSLTELRAFGTPSLITRTTNDIQQLQATLMMLLTMAMTAPIIGIGSVIMAIRQDASLSLILLASVPALGIIVGILMACSLPLFSRMQAQIDRVNQILREQIDGIRVIRAFARDSLEQSRFAVVNDALTDTALRVGRLMALNLPATNIVMQLSSIALVWFAAHRIAAGLIGVGSLFAFIFYIAQVLIAVMIASMMFSMAPRALVSGRRIREVLETSSSVAEPLMPKLLPEEASRRGEIEFRNVSFSYPGAEAAVLHDVSFRVGPGETVAVIGATGSGKSALVNLIPRLFDVTAGSIHINGIDVRDLSLATLRGQIGLTPQESYLFSGEIADNLRYGRASASDDDLWQALEVAQAKDFVSASAQGLKTLVAQGGGNFSGGQRQRLAIARTLVRRPVIYLFDDSFSALDYATDARLRAALAKHISGGAATLIVGQRITSLQSADRILVLDRGVIIGQGSHDQLMDDSEAYREIVASQNTRETTA